MSHIAFELDALPLVPKVARSAGISEAIVGWGLVQMWEWCWREKTAHATTRQLRGFFGSDVSDVLEDFGFLEKFSDGQWRVRGADRYLRIQEGRSKGGKAAIGNLKQHRLITGSPPADSPADSPADTPAEHRAFSDERLATSEQLKETTLSSSKNELDRPQLKLEEPEAPPASLAVVFEHWRKTMGYQRAKLTSDRRRKVSARLQEGYTVEDLKLAVDGCRQTPHNSGQNDKGERYDDLELICRDGAHVERFMRNAEKPPIAPPVKGRADPNDGIVTRPAPSRPCAACEAPAVEMATNDFWACASCAEQFREWWQSHGIEKPWEHVGVWAAQQRSQTEAA